RYSPSNETHGHGSSHPVSKTKAPLLAPESDIQIVLMYASGTLFPLKIRSSGKSFRLRLPAPLSDRETRRILQGMEVLLSGSEAPIPAWTHFQTAPLRRVPGIPLPESGRRCHPAEPHHEAEKTVQSRSPVAAAVPDYLYSKSRTPHPLPRQSGVSTFPSLLLPLLLVLPFPDPALLLQSVTAAPDPASLLPVPQAGPVFPAVPPLPPEESAPDVCFLIPHPPSSGDILPA